MYHARIYGVFAFVFHLSSDASITSIARSDLIKAANKIMDEKPLEALSDLIKVRAMCAIAGTNSEPYVQASEAIAMALISKAQTLEEVAEVKNKLGPWAKNFFVTTFAREAGLKAMLDDAAKEKSNHVG